MMRGGLPALALLATAAPASAMVSPLPQIATVTIDGAFDPDEWAGARRYALAGGAQLNAARQGDDLLLGLRQAPGDLRYLDVYVADAAGALRNLHASMQQGERMLPPGWDDANPAFRWGPSEAWTTNIARHTGAAQDRPLAEQLHPYDGYELRVPFAHLGPGPWRIRLEFRDFQGQAPDIVWPAGSARADPSGWWALSRGALAPSG